jgi:Zn-dependent protease with chaperone function
VRAALAAALIVYAVVVAAAGARWMPRASWPLRAPRVGITAWQAASSSVAASAIAAGLILAIPCARISSDPAVWSACLSLMRAQYATWQGAVAGLAGAGLALGIIGRIAMCASLAIAGNRRQRARHDDALTVIARPGPAPDVRIIDDDRSAVYCIPGHGRIVLTTGALQCLDSLQLDAVLAHERAHLSGRHHLVVTFASALRDAFPVIAFFSLAARQVSDLVEVAADDAATRKSHRLALAGALLAVAAARVPAGALGAGGSAAARRIRRLIDPPHPAGRARLAFISAALVTASVVAVIMPALGLLIITYCPSAHHAMNW